MGISVVQTPLAITPAFNDVPFVVTSTDYASAGFQFMGTVKNGSGTTIANLTAKVYLDSTNKGVFNLQRILESYVGYDFDLLDTIGHMATGDESVFDYEFEIGQQGGSPVVEYPNLYSFTGVVFNGALERKSYETYASGDFAVKSGNPTAQFLTEQRKFIRPDQSDWLYWLAYPTTGYAVNIVRYKSYDQAGTLLKTVDVSSGIAGLNTWQVNRTPIGRNTGNILIGDISAGTLPVIDATAAYFTVELRNGTGPATISEVFRVDIDNDCTQFDLYNIYYINKQGGFDSFAFDLKNFDKEAIDRKQYKRNNYELNGNVYDYNNDKAAVVNYDIRYQRKLTLHSQWITDDQAEDLAVLMSSPVIFMQKYGLSYSVPINIENAEWEKSQDINEALRLCKLEVVVADNNRRQIGG